MVDSRAGAGGPRMGLGGGVFQHQKDTQVGEDDVNPCFPAETPSEAPEQQQSCKNE